ncbi:MAG: hypothetical protein ABI551_25070 [Polyangiaceae bacterium]
MNVLAPISSTPYYTFDVTTSLGIATFVIVADMSYDSVQASWLVRTLTTADSKAKYTIVARHHPEGNTEVSTNQAALTVIRAHKYSLFLTASRGTTTSTNTRRSTAGETSSSGRVARHSLRAAHSLGTPSSINSRADGSRSPSTISTPQRR